MVFKNKRIRKEQLIILKNILSEVPIMLNRGIHPPYRLLVSKEFFAKLLLSINLTTHITLLERLEAMIDMSGDKIFNKMEIIHMRENFVLRAVKK